MPLTRVGLTIDTVISNSCTKITVQDITGNYNITSNPLGYGLPSGISYNDITSIIIDVYYPDITTPITYRFTLALGVVINLSVKGLNGVSYNIFASISTLYVLGIFNLTGTTAFVLPKITDGLFNVVYTISGGDATTFTEFNYTTNSNFLSTCSTDCCIYDMYNNLDMCCACSENSILNIQKAETFLLGAKYAVDAGLNDKAVCLLNKAKEVCAGNCKDC